MIFLITSLDVPLKHKIHMPDEKKIEIQDIFLLKFLLSMGISRKWFRNINTLHFEFFGSLYYHCERKIF